MLHHNNCHQQHRCRRPFSFLKKASWMFHVHVLLLVVLFLSTLFPAAAKGEASSAFIVTTSITTCSSNHSTSRSKNYHSKNYHHHRNTHTILPDPIPRVNPPICGLVTTIQEAPPGRKRQRVSSQRASLCMSTCTCMGNNDDPNNHAKKGGQQRMTLTTTTTTTTMTTARMTMKKMISTTATETETETATCKAPHHPLRRGRSEAKAEAEDGQAHQRSILRNGAAPFLLLPSLSLPRSKTSRFTTRLHATTKATATATATATDADTVIDDDAANTALHDTVLSLSPLEEMEQRAGDAVPTTVTTTTTTTNTGTAINTITDNDNNDEYDEDEYRYNRFLYPNHNHHHSHNKNKRTRSKRRSIFFFRRTVVNVWHTIIQSLPIPISGIRSIPNCKRRRGRRSRRRTKQKQKQPGTLILIRHGESQWNSKNASNNNINIDMNMIKHQAAEGTRTIMSATDKNKNTNTNTGTEDTSTGGEMGTPGAIDTNTHSNSNSNSNFCTGGARRKKTNSNSNSNSNNNKHNQQIFTGWADPDITERGKCENEHAARLLIANGYGYTKDATCTCTCTCTADTTTATTPTTTTATRHNIGNGKNTNRHRIIDVVYTSKLKRAIRSTWIIMNELNQWYIPVYKSWRLNGRMYGALTGLCKSSSETNDEDDTKSDKTETETETGIDIETKTEECNDMCARSHLDQEIENDLVRSWWRRKGGRRGLSSVSSSAPGPSFVSSTSTSTRIRPPSLDTSNKYYPGHDRRYANLSTQQIPLTESLHDVMIRVKSMWDNRIIHDLQDGKNVLIVTHGSTIRGLIHCIDGHDGNDDSVGTDDCVGKEDGNGDRDVLLQDMEIPTGIPIIYNFDEDMKSIRPHWEEGRADGNYHYLSRKHKHVNGVLLEQPGMFQWEEKEDDMLLSNHDDTDAEAGETKGVWMGETSSLSSSLIETSLSKLKAEEELEEWAVAEQEMSEQEITSDPLEKNEDEIWRKGIEGLKEGAQFDPEGIFRPDNSDHDDDSGHGSDSNGIRTKLDDFIDSNEKTGASLPLSPGLISNISPCLKVMPSPTQSVLPRIGDVPIQKDTMIVLIRHGKTEHNKLGLFTGWEDAPLAEEGKEEATRAGELLKLYGFEFDVIYTSWLSRAIETAWLVMDAMDCVWLPIVKTWRLNERMYGALTGRSKSMVSEQYGEEQFMAWRRGYTVRPPPISSFSIHYPGNDPRYKLINDIRLSASGTLMRSFDGGKLTLERKYPRSESLKDCMDRTIPYYEQVIVPEAIEKGKRVLIASSENVIRGLLMNLCEIPEEKISGLEIPNGLPLVYDFKSKCIKLLDDGSGEDPREKYNFGTAANYLFQPCKNEKGKVEECE